MEFEVETNIAPVYGITGLLFDAISKKYEFIDDLNSIKINSEEENFEDINPVIDSIIEDENNHIGKLQQLIDLMSNSEDAIEEGKAETIEIIDNPEIMESIKMVKKLRLNENFDNVYPVEFSYIDETDERMEHFYGHLNVKASSESEALKKAKDYVNSREYGNKHVSQHSFRNFRISNTKYSNVDLVENFDNVIDNVQAVADPVFVGANEEHDENKKKYEDAMKENKKAAEETVPKEGETGDKVTSKELKAMKLSEALFGESLSQDFIEWCGENIAEYILTEFVDLNNSDIRQVLKWVINHFSGPDFEESLKESLDFDDYSDFNSAVYNALADVMFSFESKNVEKSDMDKALEWFDTHFWESDGDEFETKSMNHMTGIRESFDENIRRYSDVVPYEKRKYWYFTTHGVGPGSIPKDLKVLEVKEGQNDKGTNGTYVCLDGVLNTSELKKFDMIEKAPMNESLPLDKGSYTQNNKDSFVAEWWGQTEEDPKEFAREFGLKVTPVKRKGDETLYVFRGSKEDIERARKAGYFYSLDYGEDAGHSSDLNESLQVSIAKEQIQRFTEGKMPKNWSVNGYLNKLTESKHITQEEAKSLKEWYDGKQKR